MAKLIQAINAYGPKLQLNKTAQLEQLSEWMAMRTGMNKSEALMALQELSEGILFFNNQGTPVKLPGIGIFTPSIDRHGKMKVNFRADVALKNGVNVPSAYRGETRYRSNIGLDNAKYKELWDADHPDDLLEI